MDDPGAPDVQTQPDGQCQRASAHLTYVGILLVVIIGLLAVLWSRDRRLLSRAEQNVVNLRQENHTLRQAMSTMGDLRAADTRPGDRD